MIEQEKDEQIAEHRETSERLQQDQEKLQMKVAALEKTVIELKVGQQ